MGLLEQPQIFGVVQYTHPISYACSTCAILMKLSAIKQLDKWGAYTNFQSSNVYCLSFGTP